MAPGADRKRERMSSVDTAWLRMDRPSNLMMICGVLIFSERIRLSRLKATVSERFLRFPRFRQRPVLTPAGAYWQTDASFDLAAHVVRSALPAHAGKVELEATVGGLMSESLDQRRPLWRFDLVERYGRGSAVIIRIHHCYADGIALIQVMLSMTDADREGKLPGPASPPDPEPPRDPDDPLAALIEPFADTIKFAVRTGALIVDKGAELWNDPAKAVALAGEGSALTSEIAKLLLMKEDSPTRFKGKPGVAKRAAWAERLPLPDIKAIGRALDCSVNDVLLSSVAGALGTYLRSHGDDVNGLSLRALVPVNLRPPEKAWKLGNRFGLVFLDLPLGIENPVERVYAVRANMRALKDSYQPVISLGILAAMGAGPRLLQEQLLSALARNATAVMTNVPGPQSPLYLGAAPIESLMFWVPQSGDIGMGVSILSYNDAVQFGLVADYKLCPDPGKLIDAVAPEFEKLVLATLLSPWPWTTPPSAQAVERAVLSAAA